MLGRRGYSLGIQLTGEVISSYCVQFNELWRFDHRCTELISCLKYMQVCITCVLIKCKSKQPHSQAQPLRVMKSWVDPEWGWQLDSTELNFTHKVSKTKTKKWLQNWLWKSLPPLPPLPPTCFYSPLHYWQRGRFFFLRFRHWLTGKCFGLSLQVSGSPARVWTTRSWSMVSTPTSDSTERRTSGDTW